MTEGYLTQINNKVIKINQQDSNNKINILITGDFSPINRIESICKNKDYDKIYGELLSILKNKDLSITNIETPLTTHKNKIRKRGPYLVANPICIHGIKYGDFDIATLSNNHILDYGKTGLFATIDACESVGIKTVGAGKNIDEAKKPLYIEIKGKTIAILNFTECEFSIAEIDKAGANPLDPIGNYYQILEAKRNADIVILIIHGGNELNPLPNLQMVKIYHFFADLGVTAIIGHHPHCISGFEIYNNTPIFYSLGNFIFDIEQQKESWYEGYFINLEINKNSVNKIYLFPYFQCKEKIGLYLMNKTEEKIFLKKIEDYSNIIKDPNLLLKNWIEFCDSKKASYLAKLLSFNTLEKHLYKKNLFTKLLLKEQKMLLLLNLFRCESHREAIIDILKNVLKNKK